MKANMTYWNSIELLGKTKDILVIISIISGILTVLIMISSFIINKRIDNLKTIKENQYEQEIIILKKQTENAIDSAESTKLKFKETNLKLKKIEDKQLPRHLTTNQINILKKGFSKIPKNTYTIFYYSYPSDIELRDFSNEFQSLFRDLDWGGGLNGTSANQPYKYGIFIYVKNKSDLSDIEKLTIELFKKAKIKFKIQVEQNYTNGVTIFVGFKSI